MTWGRRSELAGWLWRSVAGIGVRFSWFRRTKGGIACSRTRNRADFRAATGKTRSTVRAEAVMPRIETVAFLRSAFTFVKGGMVSRVPTGFPGNLYNWEVVVVWIVEASRVVDVYNCLVGRSKSGGVRRVKQPGDVRGAQSIVSLPRDDVTAKSYELFRIAARTSVSPGTIEPIWQLKHPVNSVWLWGKGWRSPCCSDGITYK